MAAKSSYKKSLTLLLLLLLCSYCWFGGAAAAHAAGLGSVCMHEDLSFNTQLVIIASHKHTRLVITSTQLG